LSDWFSSRRFTVTGGKGFLGTHLIRSLRGRGAERIHVADLPEYDLRRAEDVRRMYDDGKPDVVIHLAAVVGGIGANRENPGRYFYDNLMMGVQTIHEGHLRKVEKFVALGTICAYPKFTPVPFKEGDLWNGYPEETNAPYGIAKKALLVQLQAYRTQYGFDGIFLLPVNLYGPGDNFDPRSSHVIPALIRKFAEASASGAPEVEVWGTGKASREFLYVEDAVEAILLATERYDDPEPVNLGAGFEITTAELARRIACLCGYRGGIVFNQEYPDGQPRRMLDTSRAWSRFGFRAGIPFDVGLAKTVEWYRKIREASGPA
jgi:GDP-L-fucose synthase